MEMWNTVKKEKEEGDKRIRGGGINTLARLLFVKDLLKIYQFGRKRALAPLDAETEETK